MTNDRADWHKSSHSAGAENCVEVRRGVVVAMRDTQHQGLGHLEFPRGEWEAFVASASAGRL
ncbi:DUF397 domain-containing protein [Nocardiopsis sp. RSe5-2]|uniref:DUF397 domain-containing protein n=1 Tax=Nocardiopsis endophytica TaxID=3018445 RepID=A0ABT4U9B4_9ACTN|nr:DUF397 domain-containing protein [Nocardiopsis endophytica]MDA2813536.1 DUF397 domain-containing protein [Nocardiopsis endophytica]